jgi:hypothetical protein
MQCDLPDARLCHTIAAGGGALLYVPAAETARLNLRDEGDPGAHSYIAAALGRLGTVRCFHPRTNSAIAAGSLRAECGSSTRSTGLGSSARQGGWTGLHTRVAGRRHAHRRLRRCPCARPDEVRLAVSRVRPPRFNARKVERLDAGLMPMGWPGRRLKRFRTARSYVYAHAGGQYEWDSIAPGALARSARASEVRQCRSTSMWS